MYIQNLFGLQAGIVLSCMLLAGECLAQNYDPAFEPAIRKAIPQPARCSITPEPLFYCRYDNAFEGSVVLELSATEEGPAASLTFEYDDPKGEGLLAIVRGFFGNVGVDTKSFGSCVRQSHTESREMLFAYRSTEASPSPWLFV